MNIKYVSAIFALALGMQQAHAADYKLLDASAMTMGSELIAPIFSNSSNASLQSGSIFYQVGSGLKVVNPEGNIENITTTGANAVTSDGSDEHIERARINLMSGTPTVTSQSGTWIDSLTDDGTGAFYVNIKADMFSETPTCVCTGESGAAPLVCQLDSTPALATQIRIYAGDALGAGQDQKVNLICMGPR